MDEAFMMMARDLMSRNGLNVQQGDSQANAQPRLLLRSNSRPVNGGTSANAAGDKKSCC